MIQSNLRANRVKYDKGLKFLKSHLRSRVARLKTFSESPEIVSLGIYFYLKNTRYYLNSIGAVKSLCCIMLSYMLIFEKHILVSEKPLPNRYKLIAFEHHKHFALSLKKMIRQREIVLVIPATKVISLKVLKLSQNRLKGRFFYS